MIDDSEQHESSAKWTPSPAYIDRMKRIIRAENEAARQGRKYQSPVDDDCDSDLESEADRASFEETTETPV